jgi:hypothetical protein
MKLVSKETGRQMSLVVQIPRQMWRLASIELSSDQRLEVVQVCIQVFSKNSKTKKGETWKSDRM